MHYTFPGIQFVTGRMNNSGFVQTCCMLLLLVSGSAKADLFVGEFYARVDGQLYQMSIQQSSASGYEGSIRVDGEIVYQLDGRRFGDRIAGSIVSVDGDQGFIAEMGAGAPVLRLEDNRVITFRRGKAP